MAIKCDCILAQKATIRLTLPKESPGYDVCIHLGKFLITRQEVKEDILIAVEE